ncbi:pseudouridine synthase [Caballeronia telluris]|uniref:pseudouridine synthase n=1 Tax=Caballeronia telluris TaxID=326475 RepID=UPI000B3EC371
MRVKLTAKHPRPATPARSPVRSGSAAGRKPVRAEGPAGPRPAGPKTGAPREGRPDSRPAGGERGPRPSSGDRAGSTGERRPFKARGDDSRSAGGGERGPRPSFGDRGAQRGDRAGSSDERRPFKARGDDSRPAGGGERGPRPSFGDRGAPRGDRAGSSDDRRPFKARGDDSRSAGGGERGPRPSFGDRGAPRGDRAGSTDERRPFKARGDDSRSAGGGERGPRPSFGDRGAPRGDRAGSSDERRPFKSRGDDSRPPRPSLDRPRRDNERSSAKSTPKPADTPSPARQARAGEEGLVRLSKVMSELGLCSRREADEWIEKGWVLVDGVVIDTLGTRIRPDQNVEILPAAHAIQSQLVTILVHKPVGYVSGQAEDGYQPAVTLINPSNHWAEDHSGIRFSPNHLRTLAPAGRLDIDSTGLLVLTQDGRVAKQLIGGHSEVDKEYLVRVTFGEHTVDVDQHLPDESLALLRHGLELDGVPLKTAQVSWQNGEQLRFVLREGKKRQVRRMCELVGLEVVGLKRIRMGHVTLGALPAGQWRYLGADETF